jgi:hypothetical protein
LLGEVVEEWLDEERLPVGVDIHFSGSGAGAGSCEAEGRKRQKQDEDSLKNHLRRNPYYAFRRLRHASHSLLRIIRIPGNHGKRYSPFPQVIINSAAAYPVTLIENFAFGSTAIPTLLSAATVRPFWLYCECVSISV